MKRGAPIVSELRKNFVGTLPTLSTGVVSPSCRENNLVSSKRGALIVLQAILGRPIDEHLLISSENPEIHETVVEAPPVRASQDVRVEQAD